MPDRSAANAWRALVAAALLGTDRAPFTPPAAEGPLGEALARLDPADPPGALLDAAAALVTYREAGRLPPREDSAPSSPSDPDETPVAPAAACELLAGICEGQHPYLISEWLALAAQRGFRAPAALLPDVLDYGLAELEERPPIVLAVIGERGRWLAAQNPKWRYAAPLPPDAETVWRTGDRATRLAILRAARRADPGRARAIIEATWDEDRADERAAFIMALAPGLSIDDEPFLESALDDRSASVRTVAAAQLAELPGSRLVARMAARARPLIAFDAGTGTLSVTLPMPDDALRRDGMTAPPRNWAHDEATWLLQSIVACAPPGMWVTAFETTPSALIEAAQRGERESVLIPAWQRAALRAGDVAWLQALVEAGLVRRAAPQLARALDVDARERMALWSLSRLQHAGLPLTGDVFTLDFLIHCRHPWGAALTRAVLRVLHEQGQRGSAPATGTQGALREVAAHFSPMLLPEAEAALYQSLGARVDPAWRRAIEGMIEVLRVRRRLRDAFEQG
jgi:hypothetical protein